MNKFIYAFLFLLLSTTASIAQQHRYALKIGLHAGLSNYYGDLSHQVWDLPHQFKQPIQDFNFLSYGVSVEYHVSRSFGLRLWGMKSQFKASDRTYEQSSNYTRALNVQTDLFDASLLGIVYFDNDLVLNSRSVLAPYFMFGGGLTHFETRGDLLSADNNHYHYWSDNTIRTEAENSLTAPNAQIIEQDYKYETTLSTLNTEGANYSPITWNVALGLGMKFRLSSRFHLHLEALVRYTGSDYLDDVSGDYRSTYTDNAQAYAANPSNVNRTTRGESPEMNDWYTFVGLSAHYSFGQKTYDIRPSIIYTEDLLLSSTNATNPTSPTNSNVNNSNNSNTQVPTNTTGSDTTVQKIITTTTTIKTVTVDTFNNNSSALTPPTPLTPIVPSTIKKPAINNLLADSISQVQPPVAPNSYALDSTRLAIDSLAQNELPQRKVDSLLGDSIDTFVNAPGINNQLDSTRLVVDTITNNRISTPVVNTILNNSVPKVAAPNSSTKDSIAIQNQVIMATDPADLDRFRTLELQQQEQKYQYELLLQKEKYERQLVELKLQKDLEQERKKSAPNTKEQELEYLLKLEQQKLANELEKQKLLNELEVAKNRPAPDTTQEKLKLQQQKYEADLKLQQQEYEYKLKIQELQNQLNIEQLKKANEGTGAINTPAPSNTATTQDLERLTNAVKEQNNPPTSLGKDTVIINNNLPTNSNLATKEDLIRMQANQQALLLKMNNLERLANANTSQNKTTVAPSTDTVIINNNNNIYTQTTPRANANVEQDLIRMQTDQQALLLKIRTLEAVQVEAAQKLARDTVRIVQTDSIFVGNSANAELTAQLNQQQSTNNSLVAKLAVANQKSIAQQSKIDSLQNTIAKVESEKNTVASKLDVFLTEKTGTYVTKIYFDLGKSSLTAQAKENLTTLIYYLEKYPKVQFWVKGFASKTGPTEVNQRLSAERAGEVANFLKQSGIQGERIRTTPLGELDSPLKDELDRRAEIHLSF